MGNKLSSNNIEMGLSKKRNYTGIVYLIIFFAILTPDLIIATLPAFRFEQFLVLIVGLYIILKVLNKNEVKIKNESFIYIYSGFSLIILLSLVVGSFLGIPIILNDLFEIYKIIIYLFIYMIVNSLVTNDYDRFKILNFMIICIVISVLISIQQYFNLFGLNEHYVHIIAPTQFRTLVNNYPFPRVVGVSSNPNIYAVIPGLGSIISCALFLVSKKKRYLLSLSACFLGVLLTLSRTGIVFSLVGIFVFIFFYFIINLLKGRVSTFVRTIIFLLILASALLLLFSYLPEELTWRLRDGLNIKTDVSFQARVYNWREHLEYFVRSPFFGIGPGKSISFDSYADNEWLFFLRSYGIVGTIYITISFLTPFIGKKGSFYKYLYISVLSACAVYMITSVIYESFQVMSLIMVLAALIPKSNKIDELET